MITREKCRQGMQGVTWYRSARWLSVLLKSSLLDHRLEGFRMFSGTPVHFVGTCNQHTSETPQPVTSALEHPVQFHLHTA